MAAFKVFIDGHSFQVVASDSDYVKPSTLVNLVIINVTQRYDILVQAKSSASQSQGQTSQQKTKTTLGSIWLHVDLQFGPPWTARAADQVPDGFNPNAVAIIDYQSGATADPTLSRWGSEVSIRGFDYNPAVPVQLPTTPDQRIVVEFTLARLPPNLIAFLGYISLDGGDFSSLVTPPPKPPLFTIARGARAEDLPSTTNAIKLKHNDHMEVVVVNETPDQYPFRLHAHSPWIVGSGRASRDAILAENVTALKLIVQMQHDVFSVPECTTDAGGACMDLGYVVYRLNADNPGVWIMHCHIDWYFVLGLGMLLIEAEEVLHTEGPATFTLYMLLSVCNGNFTL